MAVESIGNLVPTKIPGYTDAADIQAALRAYHYGSYTFDTAETDPTELINPSIAYTINSLQDQIDNFDISDAVAKADFNAKGDLLSASADNTPLILNSSSVGNGKFLTTNSATATGLEWVDAGVTLTNTVTLTNKTLTSPTITTPALTLSTSASSTDGRIAWDTVNKKIRVGNSTAGIDFASSTLTISTPTFTSNAYTAIGTDKDKWLELNNSSTAGTFFINTDAAIDFPIGSQLNIIQTGTGQITIAATTSGTTTINGTPGLKLRAQWSSAVIIKRAANTWVAVGDLIA
jgi:hypothetical protein